MTALAMALEARQVRKRYGPASALDGIDLQVPAGTCLALVGESGSGKTTLLRCFNRMVEPDEGTVYVDGTDVRTIEPVSLRRRTGYVPQTGGLLPHWTVARNAALVPWLNARPDAADRGMAALARAGLSPEQLAARFPHELSGGQRQRVALARALADEPGLLLLDEPFGALDAITRSDLQLGFVEIRRTLPITTILVTHDLSEALLLADHVAVMRAGRLEQVATGAELLEAPATPYVARLLERSRVRVE
jgi:osmoprotectant transport system ATP-binding protein